MATKLTLLETSNKPLKKEKLTLQSNEPTFCNDCVFDWCKMRNKVSYCSQKYKGTSCYSCEDKTCKIKRIAGS